MRHLAAIIATLTVAGILLGAIYLRAGSSGATPTSTEGRAEVEPAPPSVHVPTDEPDRRRRLRGSLSLAKEWGDAHVSVWVRPTGVKFDAARLVLSADVRAGAVPPVPWDAGFVGDGDHYLEIAAPAIGMFQSYVVCARAEELAPIVIDLPKPVRLSVLLDVGRAGGPDARSHWLSVWNAPVIIGSCDTELSGLPQGPAATIRYDEVAAGFEALVLPGPVTVMVQTAASVPQIFRLNVSATVSRQHETLRVRPTHAFTLELSKEDESELSDYPGLDLKDASGESCEFSLRRSAPNTFVVSSPCRGPWRISLTLDGYQPVHDLPVPHRPADAGGAIESRSSFEGSRDPLTDRWRRPCR